MINLLAEPNRVPMRKMRISCQWLATFGILIFILGCSNLEPEKSSPDCWESVLNDAIEINVRSVLGEEIEIIRNDHRFDKMTNWIILNRGGFPKKSELENQALVAGYTVTYFFDDYTAIKFLLYSFEEPATLENFENMLNN